MIPADILKKVRRIEIRTSHLVSEVLAGQYRSVFRGRGMEFDEVREYQPGDEVSSIDWNVTARTGYPHVKRFVEERQLTVLFLVDASGSGFFGSTDRLKVEIATEVCAFLAFSAIKSNDKIGLIVFTDEVEKYVPPAKGSRHVLRVIRELALLEPRGKKTRIASALDYLDRITHRRCVVFLVSDFIGDGYKRALTIANKRHDVVAVVVTDPREVSLPRAGLVEIQDPESGGRFLLDTSHPDARALYKQAWLEFDRQRAEVLRQAGVDAIHISTDSSYVEPIVRLFLMRKKRSR
jgi:uncharacterized protein (DUF58 family)